VRGNPDLDRIREVLNDAAVLCGRLSSAVSAGDLPARCGTVIAAMRNATLSAQLSAATVVDVWMLSEMNEKQRHDAALRKGQA
jgi:hypothetical protein